MWTVPTLKIKTWKIIRVLVLATNVLRGNLQATQKIIEIQNMDKNTMDQY
jgi:hypothetical protein